MKSPDSIANGGSHGIGSRIPAVDPAVLVAALPAAMYVCDADGYLVSFNPAAAALWGREPVPGEDRWCGSVKRFQPDGSPFPASMCPVAGSLRRKCAVPPVRFTVATPAGNKVPVTAHSQVLNSSTGEISGVVVLLIEAPSRSAPEVESPSAQSQAKSLLSELGFLSMAARAPVGIFLSSPEGDLLFVNDLWCDMSGMTSQDALGKGWIQAVHPEDRERVFSSWSTAIDDNEPSTCDFRFLRADGSITWIRGGALPLDSGKDGFKGYIGTTVDIAERKDAEEGLARMTAESDRKRRLYEGILSTTPDLAYVFDLQHRFIFANQALLDMWGLTWEDARGKTCAELGYEPWHAAMHDREIELVISTQMPIRGEVPFPHGTEGVRIYDYIFSPILNADGKVEMVAGTTRDVTERKRIEDRADFLNGLGVAITSLSEEKQIIAMAAESVGRKVQADRCLFIEQTAGDSFLHLLKGWVAEGAEDSDATIPLRDFGGPSLWEESMSVPLIVDDVETHPVTSAAAADFLKRGIRSFASHPFRADGRRKVIFFLASNHRRKWEEWERSLADHVVARVWPLVERTRSEQALRESKQRLRLVSDHVPSLISHLDERARFRFANARFQEWFGVDPEKLVGTPLNELLDETIMAHRQPYVDKVLSGESVAFEGISVHRKLGPRMMYIAYDPDFGPDGKVRGFYMMSLDITERKKAEELLERRAIHSKILWEAAGVILTADDPDTMLQRVFGKIGKLLEVHAYFNFMVKPDGSGLELASAGGVSDEVKASLAHLDFGQAICGTVAANRTPIIRDGIQCSNEPMVQLVKGNGITAYACNPLIAGEKLLGTLSFASTTRERFEADEIEFMETISNYVTGAYVRHQLVENLRLADRRKDEFLATLAHELRNPLAPIRTGVEILKMKDGDSAENKITAMMERQVEQLVTLVNDLLDVSRISRGKMELRTSRVSLADSIRSATEAAMPTIEHARQELRVSIPDEPVILDADSHRLAQILSNLLNNASRYSDEGTRIHLGVTTDGDEVRIRVKDQGHGIAPEMLTHIFEMFTQLNSAGGQNSGLGIGLTLVKSLVELHGGRVWAESEGPGMGSAFTVCLPLSSSDGEVTGGSHGSPEKSSRSLKVAVIDDNRPAAETLAMALEMLGHEVRKTFSGQDGITLVKTFRPDLVFLDLGMPDMDGCETARHIRSIPDCKGVTLVALTGWGQVEARRKTKESGFDHHLVKPVDLARVRELIESLHSGAI